MKLKLKNTSPQNQKDDLFEDKQNRQTFNQSKKKEGKLKIRNENQDVIIYTTEI